MKNSTLRICPGGTHAVSDTTKEELNKDLLAFAKS